MREIMECQYNMDTGAVEVTFSDGKRMDILCNAMEDTLTLTPPMQSEYDRLIYDEPQAFAEFVLSGELETYLKQHHKAYTEQRQHIQEQLEKQYPPETARALAQEFMMYDD